MRPSSCRDRGERPGTNRSARRTVGARLLGRPRHREFESLHRQSTQPVSPQHECAPDRRTSSDPDAAVSASPGDGPTEQFERSTRPPVFERSRVRRRREHREKWEGWKSASNLFLWQQGPAGRGRRSPSREPRRRAPARSRGSSERRGGAWRSRKSRAVLARISRSWESITLCWTRSQYHLGRSKIGQMFLGSGSRATYSRQPGAHGLVGARPPGSHGWIESRCPAISVHACWILGGS